MLATGKGRKLGEMVCLDVASGVERARISNDGARWSSIAPSLHPQCSSFSYTLPKHTP